MRDLMQEVCLTINFSFIILHSMNISFNNNFDLIKKHSKWLREKSLPLITLDIFYTKIKTIFTVYATKQSSSVVWVHRHKHFRFEQSHDFFRWCFEVLKLINWNKKNENTHWYKTSKTEENNQKKLHFGFCLKPKASQEKIWQNFAILFSPGRNFSRSLEVTQEC